jgi:hypothetical protein
MFGSFLARRLVEGNVQCTTAPRYDVVREAVEAFSFQQLDRNDTVQLLDRQENGRNLW